MSYAMDSGDESSSSESVASFVCDVCQGFGDMKNPRGFSLKVEPEDHYFVRDDKCYVYVYMHHPDLDTLLASEAEGCNVCAVICSSFRRFSHDFNRQVSPLSPSLARKIRHPESVENTTQTNGETLAATRFAGVVKQERGFTEDRLREYDNGRIVLIMGCNQESGPRGSTNASNAAFAWALGTPLRPAWETLFTVFKSACVFHSQQEILR